MERLIVSGMLAIALLISGVVVTQLGVGDVAYAESGD